VEVFDPARVEHEQGHDPGSAPSITHTFIVGITTVAKWFRTSASSWIVGGFAGNDALRDLSQRSAIASLSSSRAGLGDWLTLLLPAVTTPCWRNGTDSS